MLGNHQLILYFVDRSALCVCFCVTDLLYVGDCKPSEMKAFIGDYLEKVVEPCEWRAIWHTDVFDVLVEVCDAQRRHMTDI